MKNTNKIIWKLLLVISIIILILFILFILLLDISGSIGVIYERPPTIWEKITDFISMKIYLIVELFPIYIIPLILDILLIIVSKRKIAKK